MIGHRTCCFNTTTNFLHALLLISFFKFREKEKKKEANFNMRIEYAEHVSR